jgi:hypothetical protein
VLNDKEYHKAEYYITRRLMSELSPLPALRMFAAQGGCVMSTSASAHAKFRDYVEAPDHVPDSSLRDSTTNTAKSVHTNKHATYV